MHCAERKEIPGMLDNRLLLLACVYRCDHVVLPSSRPGGCIVITIRGTAGAEICISHADAAAWCVGAAACLHRMSSMGEQKIVSHAPRSAGRPLTGDFALQALETTYLPLCSKQCSEQRGTRSPVVVPIGTSYLTEQGCTCKVRGCCMGSGSTVRPTRRVDNHQTTEQGLCSGEEHALGDDQAVSQAGSFLVARGS